MRKLAAVGLSYAAAIFLSCYLVPRNHMFLASFLSLLLIVPALFLRDIARLRLILIGAGLAVGFFWSAAYNAIFLEPAREIAGTTQCAEGRVVGFSRRYERGVSFTLRLTTPGLPNTRVNCMMWDEDAPDFEPGDLVRAEITFRDAEYLDEYLAKGYSTKAYLSGSARGELEVTGRSRLSFIYAPLYLARAINDEIMRLWPEDVAPFMAALLTGEREPLNEDGALTEKLGRSGILHVVAVSGTHVTFLVGLVSMLFKRRRNIAAACLPIIIVFMSMTGMNASVVRAGLMQLFVLSAPLINREADALTSFSAVLALLLLINPMAGYDIGLQLSFASVLGLILFAERIQGPLLGHAEKKGLVKSPALAVITRFFISSLACTIAALVFTTPLLAIYFGYVPLYSILTNILTLWMVTFEFTAGVIICVVGAVFPLAGMMLAHVMAWGVRYILTVVELVCALPFSALYTSYNLAAWWLVFAYIVFFDFYVLREKNGGFRPVLPACISLSMLFAVLFFSITRAPGVAAVDVGQGQSIVFVSNSGAVVVDCGGPSGNGSGEATARYLLSRNRRSVELLVLTHLHADHANGAAVLMELVDVRQLVIPLDDGDDDKMLQELLEAAAKTGTKVLFLAGNAGYTLGEMRFELFAPIGANTKNERGIIVTGSIGEFDALITGDVDAATERRLIARHELERFELLVVGHHGSRYSTSPELLERIEPLIAFISVGKNSYGHPTGEVLERLYNAGAVIYRTDLHGNIEAEVR